MLSAILQYSLVLLIVVNLHEHITGIVVFWQLLDIVPTRSQLDTDVISIHDVKVVVEPCKGHRLCSSCRVALLAKHRLPDVVDGLCAQHLLLLSHDYGDRLQVQPDTLRIGESALYKSVQGERNALQFCLLLILQLADPETPGKVLMST